MGMSLSLGPLGLGLTSSLVGKRGGAGVFLDSVNGDDSFSGLSSGLAKATLTAFKTLALAQGNGVILNVARGSSFDDADFDISTLSGVSLRDYGTGVLPIFDGSNVYAGAWQTSVDRADANNKVYSVTVTQTVSEGYISVWRNGVKPVFVATLAACQATANTFFIADDGTGSGKSGAGAHTVYFHLPADGNPNSDGAVYRITDVTKNGAVALGPGSYARGIHTRRQLKADGSFTAGINSVAEGCVFEDGVKHESLMESGRYHRCVAWHQHPDIRTPNIMMEFYTGNGTGLDVAYDTCVAVGPNNDYTQSITGFGGHNLGAGTYYRSATNTDCTAADVLTAAGTQADTVSLTRLYGRHVDSLSGCIGNNAAVPMLDCRMHAERSRVDVRVVTLGAHTSDGFRSFIQGRCDAIFFTSGNWTAANSEFVFSDISAATFFATQQASGTVMNITSSIFAQYYEGASSVSLYAWSAVGAGVFGSRSNNVYYTATPTKMPSLIDNVVYTTPAAFLAAYPETGTVLTDPVLEDPARGLWSGSAITNGAGLVRPTVTYTAIPANLNDALAFADGLPRIVLANEREPLSSIVASTNLASVRPSRLAESAAASGTDWDAATNAILSTDIRTGFSPSGLTLGSALKAGAGLQNFKLQLRKTAGAPNPTVNVELWENGVSKATLLSGTSITSASEQVVTATWNSSSLSGTGALAQCRVVSTPGQGGPQAAFLTANVGTINSVGGTPVTVNYPAAVNAGDLLVLDLTFNGFTTSSNATVPTPSGWTAFGGNPYDNASSIIRKIIFWKIAAGTEGGTTLSVTPTATLPSAGRRMLDRMYRFSPPSDAVTPITGIIKSSGAAGAITPPDVTTALDTSLAAVLVGQNQTVAATIGNFTGETGGDWNEAVAELSDTHALLQLQTATMATAGTITGGTVTPSATGDWVCVGFAVKPASAYPVNTVEIGAVEWNVAYDV